jgi:hypothetical protein
MLRHGSELPFAVIGDPERKLYAEFEVETSLRSTLDPRAWGPAVRAITAMGPSPPERDENPGTGQADRSQRQPSSNFDKC